MCVDTPVSSATCPIVSGPAAVDLETVFDMAGTRLGVRVHSKSSAIERPGPIVVTRCLTHPPTPSHTVKNGQKHGAARLCVFTPAQAFSKMREACLKKGTHLTYA
ncbi:hypothetical protein BVI2075_110023 [Burkholderia vietnamiensis]|nr:hypothetical protein BVI2075_110023 [Burkholderia vietnamiensis]CAG9217723.1 hypothetical protein BVI1335_310003 [Burkholderia vietnamiensis]